MCLFSDSACWAAGFRLNGGKLSRRGGVSVAWIERFEPIKIKVGVRRAVALLESARVEVPTVIGWFRPVILLPIAALSGLDPADLDAILAHELAHIRRHDYLINLMQCMAETLLFYHPAARWVSGLIRQEREHCCDELAVAACGDAIRYARALASMEGLRGPKFSLAPAANGGALLPRIRRILNPKEPSMKPARMLACLAVVLALAPALMAARFALEDPPKIKITSSPGFNRTYADIVANVDEAPTGRLRFEGDGEEKAEPLRWPTTGKTYTNAELIPYRDVPIPEEFLRPEHRDKVPVLVGNGDCRTCLNPPSEAEVWEKVPTAQGNPLITIRNVKMLIEKIGEKVDEFKVYPLAGVCQLVHCHYKATVSFDEITTSNDPIPINHKKARVEIVFIDKDHLRRPAEKPAEAVKPAPEPETVDQKIERLSRELEDLKEMRRQLQLKKPGASIQADQDKLKYLTFFLGAFW